MKLMGDFPDKRMLCIIDEREEKLKQQSQENIAKLRDLSSKKTDNPEYHQKSFGSLP